MPSQPDRSRFWYLEDAEPGRSAESDSEDSSAAPELDFGEVGPPPAGLRPLAAAAWCRMAADARHLKTSHRALLRQYAELAADIEELVEEATDPETGKLVKLVPGANKGVTAVNPAYRELNRLRRDMQAVLKALKATPQAEGAYGRGKADGAKPRNRRPAGAIEAERYRRKSRPSPLDVSGAVH